MRPGEIRARLRALRESGAALRARPAGEVIDALAQVLAGWSDARSSWRVELEATLPDVTGFTPAVVGAGLQHALTEWTGNALRELVRQELGSGDPPLGFPVTAVLLGGSIPMPTLLSLLAPLVLRSPVLAKSASRDPLTARLVARSLAETDPGLGACVGVLDFPGADAGCVVALLEADCVVATGSDETIDAVRAGVAPGVRLVAHGHGLSVAALGAEVLDAADRRDVAGRLAIDIALWDQLGCLSPVSVYVVGEEATDALAEALVEALAQTQQRLPRGRVEPAAATLAAHERAEAELRAAAGQRVALTTGTDASFCVVREADATPRPAPLHRFVRVHPVADADGLLAALRPLAPHLAGVALEGFGAAEPGLRTALEALGATRITRPGALQSPPLAWRRDGLGVLDSLLPPEAI